MTTPNHRDANPPLPPDWQDDWPPSLPRPLLPPEPPAGESADDVAQGIAYEQDGRPGAQAGCGRWRRLHATAAAAAGDCGPDNGAWGGTRSPAPGRLPHPAQRRIRCLCSPHRCRQRPNPTP